MPMNPNLQPSFSPESNVPLASLTTIGLGGPAEAVASCSRVAQIRDAFAFARERSLPVQILGGGSNIIFSDEGFPGLVIRIGLRGITVFEGHPCEVTVGAGEVWDDVVAFCIDYNLGGVECLSGIPGLAGATPIQNVGAYGQEVSNTILRVSALDRTTLEPVEFPATACWFGYRKSRFKLEDAGRYVITAVTFGLHKNAVPVVRYPELQRALEADETTLQAGRPGLLAVRQAVLALRRKKSMVLDPDDPNTRSVGSFFVNPVVTSEAFAALQQRWAAVGNADAVPSYPSGSGIKVPAAWLVEHAGFPRGFRRGGVGISDNHALALVNYGGTASELLRLAEDIQRAVHERFGVALEPEPVIVHPPSNTAADLV